MPAQSLNAPRALFEKIWDRHVIVQRGENESLMRVDRNLVHDGSFHAFAALEVEGRKVRKPEQTFAVADHYVPTRNRDLGVARVKGPEIRSMLELFERNTRAHDIRNAFGLHDPRQGKLLEQNIEAASSTPEELARYLRSDIAKWAAVVKAAGIKVEGN